MVNMAAKKARQSAIWERELHDHYVEPEWCSLRLFEEESFSGKIYDPCCGFGTIPNAAIKAGLQSYGSDLVNRGFCGGGTDFLQSTLTADNIVCNPPFNLAQEFALRALKLAARKVAMIFPVSRLNAARWMLETPLKTVWILTPRPSMPPGHVIASGQKPGGGTVDYCWAVWERDYTGSPELHWLHRDKDRT